VNGSRQRCPLQQHRQIVRKFKTNTLSLPKVMNFINTIHDMFRHVSVVTKSRYLLYADVLYLNRTECAKSITL
jgi:hypothetical protein